MIAYTCKYVPVELFAGFGEEAVKRNPTVETFAQADQLGHRNLCSYARALLQDCREHPAEKLVLTTCCDSMRRTADILTAAQPADAFLFVLDLPHADDSCARSRYAAELRRFLQAYTQRFGTPFDLQKCRAAFAREAEPPAEPYLALLGARSNEALLQMLQQELPLPVRDLTCVGSRRLPQPPPTTDLDAFLEWYAGALLGQVPCMRMTQVGRRRTLLEDPALRGILYHTLKFCDYYGFSYADLQKETALPLLKLETDGTSGSQEQLRTRVQAFSEQIAPERHSALQKNTKQFVAGIDSGSTTTNVVILEGGRRIAGSAIVATGARAAQSAQKALAQALAQAHLQRADLGAVYTTGYGRAYLGFGDKAVTEITCHAKGAGFLEPAVRTILDIGGQDSKAIGLEPDGSVRTFVMNDKCAAGTGRFLEMMARVLEFSMDEMSACGLHWKEEISISSMCTVFAESEVVSLVAQNKRTEDIVHGLNRAVAQKAASLLGRVGLQPKLMMTGGVAANRGVVQAVEQAVGQPVLVVPQHQLCGALGAALLAWEQA